MAQDGHLVDIDIDPLAERRRRRRVWLRVGLPVAGVGLIVAALLAIALWSDRVNRAGVLVLSDDLLGALEHRIATEVSAWLDPAARVAKLARSVVGEGAATTRADAAGRLAATVLAELPQIANVLFADIDGNFLLVRRGAAGGTEEKRISETPRRQVTWIQRDADGREIGRRDDPADEYDPRRRAWFTGARGGAGDVFWTGVYVFFSDRAPGITAAVPGPGGTVFGVDIRLRELSDFLAGLRIGRNGRAVLIDGAGRLVAAPDPAHMLREDGKDLVPVRIDELGDPVLAAAWDRFRVEGPGRRVLDVGGVRQVTIVANLPQSGRDWMVVLAAAEADFSGFVQASGRSALLMSLVVVGLAGGLAALLVVQGLRADRAARDLLDRSAAISRQSAGYARLALEAGLFDPAGDAPPRALTETLAEVTGADRASLWRLLPGGTVLRCEDSFERASSGHVGGLEIACDEAPLFFARLLAGEEVAVDDAAKDRATAALHRALMHKLGTRALLAVPVRRGDSVAGAVWLEDARDRPGTRDFVRAVANMVALRMVAPSPAGAKPDASAPTVDRPAAERSLAADLSARGLDRAGLAAEVFTDVSVLVLRFGDPGALGARSNAQPGDADPPLADRIACLLQEIGGEYDIPYLKFLGQELVAAAGFGSADTTSLSRLAAAALALRDRCAGLFDAADLTADFRIGLDCGLAIGSAVGREPRLFNLWGEAVRSATAMADSAPPAGIQATEAAYRVLRRDFLFRPRGSFYIPRVGEARTFILAGRT